MKLTVDEERILAGKEGSGLRKAMELLVAVGEAFDAEVMIDVASSHIVAPEMQLWPNIEQFQVWLKELVAESIEEARSFRVPVTINPVYMKPQVARKIGFPQSFIDEVEQPIREAMEKYKRLGAMPTYTCCPFFTHVSRRGEHLGGAESVAILFYNTVFGAMVNRESGPTSLATALTGKTPLYGLHLPENRRAQALVELKDDINPRDFDYADYNALSYYVGKEVKDKIPVFKNLPKDITITQLKYLCAPLGVSSGLPMLHAVGITPEAPTLEAALRGQKEEMKLEVGRREVEQTFEALCTAKDEKVNIVLFGCPHATVEEMAEIAQMLEGKKLHEDVKLVVATSEAFGAMVQEMGIVGAIEDAGGLVATGMCVGTNFLVGRLPREIGLETVATNSAKAASYLGAAGVKVWFGNTKQCVTAALEGRWKGR